MISLAAMGPAHVLLLTLGIVCEGLGVLFFFRSRRNVARGRRMLHAGSGMAGIVAAGPDGTFVAPLSGRAAVWCRLHLEGASSQDHWHRTGTAIHGLRFAVADPAGATIATVLPRGLAAPMLLRTLTVAATATGEARAFYDAHLGVDPGGVDTSHVTEDGRPAGIATNAHDVRWLEEALLPGDPVFVLGQASASVPPELSSGAEELLLGTGSREALGRRMMADRKIAHGVVALGLSSHAVLAVLAVLR